MQANTKLQLCPLCDQKDGKNVDNEIQFSLGDQSKDTGSVCSLVGCHPGGPFSEESSENMPKFQRAFLLLS